MKHTCQGLSPVPVLCPEVIQSLRKQAFNPLSASMSSLKAQTLQVKDSRFAKHKSVHKVVNRFQGMSFMSFTSLRFSAPAEADLPASVSGDPRAVKIHELSFMSFTRWEAKSVGLKEKLVEDSSQMPSTVRRGLTLRHQGNCMTDESNLFVFSGMQDYFKMLFEH